MLRQQPYTDTWFSEIFVPIKSKASISQGIVNRFRMYIININYRAINENVSVFWFPWKMILRLRTRPAWVSISAGSRIIAKIDQDQDSLLVKRRNDNHSPGPVIRELVPSFHQRSDLSNAILCIFSRWDQRIGEGISIPDSLGEEATFINICISNGNLKCHRVLISTTPSFGDKVIWWYTGFTFTTFI